MSKNNLKWLVIFVSLILGMAIVLPKTNFILAQFIPSGTIVSQEKIPGTDNYKVKIDYGGITIEITASARESSREFLENFLGVKLVVPPASSPEPVPAKDCPETFKIDLTNRIRFGVNGKRIDEEVATSNFQLSHDKNDHEASHGINSTARAIYAGVREGTGVHIGFDENGKAIVTWVDEPRGNILGLIASNVVPDFFKNPPGLMNRYRTYLTGARQRNIDEISNLFDEWGAYNAGGEARLRMRINGQKKALDGTDLNLANIIEGPADYIIIGGSVALYLRNNDPRYFQSAQFKNFFKFQIEKSATLINKGLATGDISDAGHTNFMLDNLRKNPQAARIRQVLVELYGRDWTQRVLGF